MSQPTLSILIPNYNHGKFLANALTAILAQSYQPLEIIILDDASTDHSLEVLDQFTDRVQLLHNKTRQGVIYNLNYLTNLAAGDYVYFAAADDQILPGFLERSMHLLAQHPEAGLCSTQTFLMNDEGTVQGVASELLYTTQNYLSPSDVLIYLQSQGPWFAGNATIYRKKALIDAGGFLPELESFCDGFIQEVIALRYGVCFIREPLAIWRVSDQGYALGISRNIEREQKMIGCVIALMETTYRDTFPPRYKDVVVKRLLRRYSVMNLVQVQNGQWGFVDNLQQRLDIKGVSALDHITLLLLKNLIRVENVIIKLLLGLRFGFPYDKVPRGIRKILSYMRLLN